PRRTTRSAETEATMSWSAASSEGGPFGSCALSDRSAEGAAGRVTRTRVAGPLAAEVAASFARERGGYLMAKLARGQRFR
ncbi:hypothetical protein, partial [Candidatus Palauibacter sp.]|uniref:hypothetical protein n=1 Tax=Candidatus Palauibacter sp. TaxID=3101350 RepID=UPI003AF2E9F6